MRTTIMTLCSLCCLIAGPALAARDHHASGDISSCTSDAQCTLVEASCETNCDVLPVNSAYAANVEQGRTEICGNRVNTLPACRARASMAPACVNGRCAIRGAAVGEASWQNYKRPGDEGWTWASQKEGWDKHGFTAYDLPQELVKTGKLELRNR